MLRPGTITPGTAPRFARQMSRFQDDFTIKRTKGITDTAGIQKQSFAPPVHQRTMGVAEEKKIQVLFFGGVSRRE